MQNYHAKQTKIRVGEDNVKTMVSIHERAFKDYRFS